MLAQNFKSADELHITKTEHQALIKVLGMLERGELKDAKALDNGDYLFNMGSSGRGCGTAACIGGWVAMVINLSDKKNMEDEQIRYVNSYEFYGSPLYDLYWNGAAIESVATVAEAAIALRSFLTTGNANWNEALKGNNE